MIPGYPGGGGQRLGSGNKLYIIRRIPDKEFSCVHLKSSQVLCGHQGWGGSLACCGRRMCQGTCVER